MTLTWRFKPDFDLNFVVITAHQGGVKVFDLNTSEALWEIPEEEVRPHAHLEYSNGHFCIDRFGNALEVWRRNDIENGYRGEHDEMLPENRGHFTRVAILPHERETRGFQLDYPHLSVVSSEGHGYLYDVSGTPSLIRQVDIERGAIGHLDQCPAAIVFSIGTNGYHFHSKTDGRLMGTFPPQESNLTPANYFHAHHPQPPMPGGSAGTENIPAPSQHVENTRLGNGTLQENPPSRPRTHEMASLQGDDWGADWEATLATPSLASQTVSVLESETDDSRFDLGGWLSVRHGKVLFEVSDRIYILHLPPQGELLNPATAPPIQTVPSNSYAQLPVPISYMSVHSDAVMSTYATLLFNAVKWMIVKCVYDCMNCEDFNESSDFILEVMQDNANMLVPEDEDEIENIIEDFDQDEQDWEDIREDCWGRYEDRGNRDSSATQLSSPPASPAHRFISIHEASHFDRRQSAAQAAPGIPITPSSESYLPFPRSASPAPATLAPSPSLSHAVVSSPLAVHATLSPPATPSLAKRPLNPITHSPRSSIASVTSPTHRQSMALAVSLSLAGSVASSRCSSSSAQSRLSSRRSSLSDYPSKWSDEGGDERDSDDDQGCDIFKLGDVFGEGYDFQGQPVRSVELGTQTQQRLTDRPKKMEVVKKLGTGSYAAVYAMKEILQSDHDSDEDDFELSGVPNKNVNKGGQPRMFALKALSKKNLDDSQLEIQMYEARIHQSLPVNQNIVTLYHTLETSNWLFLLMEYCPGQDLYYWLQGRLDESSLDLDEESDQEVSMSNEMTPSASTLAATPLARNGHSLMDKYLGGVGNKTPSTPSLLANVDTRNTMEGRARLRLISRMFESMCEAVAVCHDNGISHRDIKPENFIVTDGVDVIQLGDGRTKKERKVICKLTDFGLSTFDTQSSDFDCGSKSYMAFECRNNLNPTYNPKPADVWSLGIVLLNMLFKRNPWGEPSVEADESFDYYCQDPQMFLTGAFALTEPAAEFLAKNVLCEETKDHHRVGAREFGRWARDLHKHVELPNQPSPLSNSIRPAVLGNSFTPLNIPSRPQSPVKLSRSDVLNNNFSEIANTSSPRLNKVATGNEDFDPDLDDTLPSPLPMPERKLESENEMNRMVEEATPRVTKSSPNKSALLEFEDRDDITPGQKSSMSFQKNKPTKVQRESFEHTTTPTMATAWNSYGQRRDRIGKRQQAANQSGGGGGNVTPNGSTPSNHTNTTKSTTPSKPGFRPLNTSAPAQGGISKEAPNKPVGVYRPPAARKEKDNKEIGHGEKKVYNNGNVNENANTNKDATTANANEQRQAELRKMQSQVPYKSSSFKTGPHKPTTKGNNNGYQGANQATKSATNSSTHRANESGQRAIASRQQPTRELETDSQQTSKSYNKHKPTKTFEHIQQAPKSSRPFARLVGLPFGHVHIHRFIITAITVSSKALCDVFCTASHYSKVGGISLNELNLLEREFLRIIDWNLTCDNKQLEEYYLNLVNSHPNYTLGGGDGDEDIHTPNEDAITLYACSPTHSKPQIIPQSRPNHQDITESPQQRRRLS
ncbi:hypothetical protein E3P86_02438 [Wallemia ichthyophaga]|uniref:non-specific serine/threonine protein kinase n=1 Tax=Wallemia ichthyophaga TaxID=245174 RepID=A0A4T0J1Y9_WALIC|nr:hypothetical protein E3P86_02438 [Wallemia ichthyophaga]